MKTEEIIEELEVIQSNGLKWRSLSHRVKKDKLEAILAALARNMRMEKALETIARDGYGSDAEIAKQALEDDK